MKTAEKLGRSYHGLIPGLICIALGGIIVAAVAIANKAAAEERHRKELDERALSVYDAVMVDYNRMAVQLEIAERTIRISDSLSGGNGWGVYQALQETDSMSKVPVKF